MKKITVILAALFVISTMMSLPFAGAAQHRSTNVAKEIIRGDVVSVDVAKREIVVKDQKTGQDRAFTVSEKAVSTLKPGESVKVTIKAGSSVVESVKIVEAQGTKK